MNHLISLKTRLVNPLAASLIFFAAASPLAAQQAVTVSGHVTAEGGAVPNAHVRILSLKIDRTTDAEGYYSFIIGSSNVRGQSVRISVVVSDRKVHYAPASADITLAGVPITKDFDLKITSGERAPAETEPSEETGRRADGRPDSNAPSSDTLTLGELAGAVDLPSALVGRFPGLSVVTPNVLGGSPLAAYRGPRSILGTSQPMIVLDGVPLDNSVFSSSAQRFGIGGFDYGSTLADLDLSTIASVQFFTGPQAAARFGGRGANGVLLINSKDGVDGPGFAISAGQQITSETPGRMPVFQNQYGQGLDGKYQFFNGKGGGINDGVDQSWGPVLDGRPLSQASLTEAGVADVRLWTAHPSNVSDYFATGRTLNTTAALQGSTDLGSFRASFGNRDTKGLTPLNTLLRRDGAFNGTLHPQDDMTVTAWVTGGQTTNTNAPGTGFNQGNPIAEFTRMGRQVDATTLRTHLIDASGNQISWDYAGQNNPYFAALENSNQSQRDHVTAGGSFNMALAPWLSATVRGGSDYSNDTRTLSIHSGFMGGFPFFAAPAGGNFSKGGFEGDQIWVQESNVTARLDGTRALSDGKRWTLGAGAEMNTARYRIRTVGVDSAADVPSAGAPDTATVPQAASWSAHSRTNAVFGETSLLFSNSGALHAALRDESASIVPGQHASTLYPAVDGSIDLVRAMSSLKLQKTLSAATVRAGFWSSAGELTPYTVETMYAGHTPSGSIAPLGGAALTPDSSLTPERTNAWQVGADLSLFRRTDVSFTVYHEQTSDVILPVTNTVLHTVSAMNAGTISNSGVEGQATTRFGDGDTWLGWEISGNAAHNTNSVDKLAGTLGSLALSPNTLGVTVMARQGQPLGVLMGQRLLRDPATNALLLKNGLPVADSAAGLQQLGVAQPDWVVGLRSTVRFRWLSLSARADGHIGGSIFSTTNLMGSVAGTLSETAFRPDSGLLIPGLDAVTKKANTQHVSTQDYFHALGTVAEPWIYSASYFKVREVRISVAVPTNGFAGLPFSGLTASVVARNVYLHAKAPNIDPETLLSPYQFSGVEMGQLPATKSVGFQVSITP